MLLYGFSRFPDAFSSHKRCTQAFTSIIRSLLDSMSQQKYLFEGISVNNLPLENTTDRLERYQTVSLNHTDYNSFVSQTGVCCKHSTVYTEIQY